MTSDDKKIKPDPANKNDVPSKDKSTFADTSKAEGGKIADTVSYGRGEGQKPVSQAYRNNWNAIFARNKEAIIWQFFCQHRCVAAPTNRCIFAPVFMALDFSVRSPLLPPLGQAVCSRNLVPLHIRKKARKKSRAFVTSVEGGLNSPYPPYPRREASPEHRPASSALQRPWLPW
jgi:hypothetical protein